MESKTPATKQRRTCVECGIESNAGGIALHQKASGHEGWVPASEYSKWKFEKLVEDRKNEAISKKIQEALDLANESFARDFDKQADIHEADLATYKQSLAEAKKAIDILSWLLIGVTIALAICFFVFLYLAYA